MDKNIVLLSLCMLFVACNGTGDKPVLPGGGLEGDTYSGVIPCADCEGILYELSLQEDGRFKAASTYIGESSRPFIDTGSYTVRDDTLLLLEEDSGEARNFAIADSALVMLDTQSRRISGPLSDLYVLDRKVESSTAGEPGRWAGLRDQGVDFRASGNEPFWGLQIDFDQQINFYVLDGDSVQSPVPEMEQDTATSARFLKTETASGTLNIALYPIGCMDTMSGKIFSHRVVVESGEEAFRGCGNYINSRYELHDFWALYSLRGADVPQRDAAGGKHPALQFDLTNGKVYGNSGCNQVSGGVAVQDDSLSFTQLISTKMACQGTMELESRFLDALDQTDSYAIRDGELLLFQKRDTLMVFRRAE